MYWNKVFLAERWLVRSEKKQVKERFSCVGAVKF